MTTKINDLISRFENQYFYGEEVGTYVIELEDNIVLFDLPTYSKEIEEYFLSFNKPLVALLSHGSCGIPDGTLWQEKAGLKVYLHKDDENHTWLRMKPNILFTEDNVPAFNDNLVIIPTPGHSDGSICLLEKTTKTLFTGDTFGGLSNGEIRDFFQETGEDTKQRFESCKKLLDYDFENVLPFHYKVILKSGKESLKEFVRKHS